MFLLFCFIDCLVRYTQNKFPKEYIPTVFDNFSESKSVEYEDDKSHKVKCDMRLDLWDTAGQEEFDRIRPLSYRDASYFLICFSVGSYDSFDHVMDKWVPEIQHHAPHKQYLFVGLKSDLRKNNDDSIVDMNTITQCCQESNADGYIECSALTGVNVNLVFETAMKTYLKQNKQPKPKKEVSETMYFIFIAL